MNATTPRPAPGLETLACRDRNAQSAGVVAALMREPQTARNQQPIVRLVEDDFDGVYDDRPAQAAAAA